MDRYRQCSKFATILDFHIHAKGSNPYGEVDDGWIKLKAPLIQVFIKEDPATRWTKGVFGFTTANQKGMENNSFLDYNIDIETIRKLSLFTVVFGRDMLNKPTILYPNLLVTPTGYGQYRRLSKILLDENGLGRVYAEVWRCDYVSLVLATPSLARSILHLFGRSYADLGGLIPEGPR